MKRKTRNPLPRNPLQAELCQPEISTGAAREYITDMLAELCAVAEQCGQEDLHILLKLTHQAVRTAA